MCFAPRTTSTPYPQAQIEMQEGAGRPYRDRGRPRTAHPARAPADRRLQEQQQEARRIQQNLLSRGAPSLPGVQLQAVCAPVGTVGGDWYDYIPLGDGRVAIVLADVSGKGMPAALLMSAARGIVRSLAPLASGPGEVLARVDRILLDDLLTGHYVTMIYAVLDVRPLHTDSGMPLGLLPCEFSEHTVRLCRDFRLLFGDERLAEFVANHDCSVTILMEAIDEFRGSCAQKDDATVVLLRRT